MSALSPDGVPVFPRGVRFRFDETRGVWVILAPERVFLPDEPAVAVLSLVDGERSFGTIVAALAERFDASVSVIEADVRAMLEDLLAKRVLVLRTTAP